MHPDRGAPFLLFAKLHLSADSAKKGTIRRSSPKSVFCFHYLPKQRSGRPVKARRCGLFARVIIGDCVRTGIIIPIPSLGYSIPLRLCTAVFNARKACAIIERPFANACDVIGDNDARKACAIIERPPANACDAIGDRHTRKAGAII